MNVPIAYQPTAKSIMRLSADLHSQQEKALQIGTCTEHDHHHRPSRKLRMATLVSLGLTALSISAFIFFSYLDATGGEFGGSMVFWKRAVGSTGTGDNQTPFVRNKLWIIVLVLGLLACIVFAVMLSAWCCRGAFDNPLCCPCYLCACCGGLACLECISCGICADLASQ